ncbi:MAG: ComEA family DNA-binding protein [Gammaproteobacteria bacterium]|nr:ComEA family DNA-binding protein [Gammaproteobacteria bacterium]
MIVKKYILSALVLVGLSISTGAFAETVASKADSAPVASASLSAPVNVNTADVNMLETVKGLGPSKAQAIIDYRNKNGHYKTIQDVENVPGIGPKLLEKIQSQITV